MTNEKSTVTSTLMSPVTDCWWTLAGITNAIKRLYRRDRSHHGPEIGALLQAGKAILPRGMYGKWVQQELGLKLRDARRYSEWAKCDADDVGSCGGYRMIADYIDAI